MVLIEDGEERGQFKVSTRKVTKRSSFTLKLRGYGGFAATVTAR